MKKIHVYILHYERELFLFEALRSVLDSGIRCQDITILDNGSSEKTIKNIKERLSSEISWRRLEKNSTFATNFKRCFDCDDSEYFIALHDDDRLMKNFFFEQVEYLEKNGNISLISCNGRRIDAKGKIIDIPLLSNVKNKDKFIKFDTVEDLGIFMMEGSCIPFSPILYRRKTVKKYVEKIIEIENKFGQGVDRAFLSLLVESGECIALNTSELYECRMHDQQDSKNISNLWDIVYIDYLLSKETGDSKTRSMLERKIMQWYSINFIRNLYMHVKKMDFKNALSAIFQIRHDLISLGGLIIAFKLGMKCFENKKND